MFIKMFEALERNKARGVPCPDCGVDCDTILHALRSSLGLGRAICKDSLGYAPKFCPLPKTLDSSSRSIVCCVLVQVCMAVNFVRRQRGIAVTGDAGNCVPTSKRITHGIQFRKR